MSASENGEGNINDILREIGVPGRYQLCVFFLTFIAGMTSSWQLVAVPFLQGDMAFRCADKNSSGNDVFNNTCFLFNSSIECEDFEYDTSIFSKTVVSEFDLVCSRVSYTTISNMAYMVVAIPFGVVSGWLSDRFGRRINAAGSMLAIGVTGLAIAFSANIEMYIALKCVLSFPAITIYDSTNSLLSEITSPVKRPHLLIGSIISWSMGICLASPLAYWLTNWVHLQIAISVPCIALAGLLWWVYDESPHWLCSKKRYNEAEAVLKKIARRNGFPDTNVILTAGSSRQTMNHIHSCESKIGEGNGSAEEESEAKEAGKDSGTLACLILLKHPRFAAVFAICSFGWFSCNLGYYGLMMGIGDLVGDIYINNLLAGGVEFVSYMLCFFTVKGGRKGVYVSLLLIGGVALIASAICMAHLSDIIWLTITLTMIGRLSMAAAWQILYVWCLELFPTRYRLMMLQGAFTFGHIGSTVGVLMADLPKLVEDSKVNVEMAIPILYGSLLLISGLTALYPPETNNKPLPVTIDDAVKATKRKVKELD